MDKKETEIDLIELFRNIIIGIYFFFRRRYKFLLVALGFGAFAGAILFVVNKDKSEFSFVGTSEIIPSNLTIQVINSFDQILKNDKTKAARLLCVDKKEIENLISIEADTLKTNLTIAGSPFSATEIKTTFKKGFNTDGLISKIKRYLDSNKFIAKELEIEKNKSERLVKKYDGIITKLENLQKSILKSNYESAELDKNLLVISNKSQEFHHTDLMNFEEKKQVELKKMQRVTAFSVISEGGIKKQSTLGTNLLYGIGLISGIALIFCMLLELRRYALIQENKRVNLSISEPHYIEKKREAKIA